MEKNKSFDNKLSVIHGILAIVFGVFVVAYPGLSVSVLATFFGLVLLLGGAVLIIGAYISKDSKKGGLHNFLLGIVSIVLGIVILSYPKESVAAFLLLSVGIWALVTGGILIWGYTKKIGDGKRRPVTLVFGITSLFFGLFMALQPVEGTYAVAVIVGIYAILYGLHALIYPVQKN